MPDGPLRITNNDARNLLLNRYALESSPKKRLKKNDLVTVIDRLGYVQIDSLRIIERAHHMILASRSGSYQCQDLDRLLEKDRLLFENWTHDASVIPIQFYPYWQAAFEQKRQELKVRWQSWHQNSFLEECSLVLDYIGRNGPTRARDLAPENGDSSGWWNWHPAKTAMEFLWRTGRLAVSSRQGFQKAYDLSERVIPKEFRLDTPPKRCELVNWASHQALLRMGFATAGQVAGFFKLITAKEASNWLEVSRDNLIQVEIETNSRGKYLKAWALPSLEDELADISVSKAMRILSPFDPLIRDRSRLMQVFGFDYRIEIFVPKEKRRFGYYVCPILEHNRFCGRIECKADREQGRLVALRLWLEPRFTYSKKRTADLGKALERLAALCGLVDVDTSNLQVLINEPAI